MIVRVKPCMANSQFVNQSWFLPILPRKLFVALIFLTHSIVNAQIVTTTRGLVIDKGSKKAIPYASITIERSTRGAAANENGEFVISCREGDDHIRISSIGYKSATFAIRPGTIEERISFELAPEVIQLKEFELVESRINPMALIKSAIDSIGRNYKKDSFNIEFYSKVDSRDLISNKTGTAEFIILGYYDGYASSTKKKFQILRKRLTGENPMKAADIELWPTFEIRAADLIGDPAQSGILHSENLDKFNFTYNGVLVYDADTVYHISYHAPKPTRKITRYGIVPKTYKGEIYITIGSHAIVRHDIETDRFQYSIIYKKIQDWYFPYMIRGERQFNHHGILTATNFISMRSLFLDNVETLESKTNEKDELENIPDDSKYWVQNYPEGK
jgi:hypothetical protein